MTTLNMPRPASGPLLALRDIGGVARRNVIRYTRSPSLVLYLIQPVMMLLLFRYVLGGAIRVPGGDYTSFIVPAILVLTLLVGAMTSAIGIAGDLRSGMIDRFRSMPMARSAVLTGRSVTDLARSIVSLAVMAGLGVATGFRFHASPGRIAAGMALILALGYAFCWVNTAIGILARDPESAQNAGVGPMFVLLFASNAIVPAATLPGWLQPFARNQPLGVTVSAVRALFSGGPVGAGGWISLAWSAGLTAAFFALSYVLYQRAASR